MNVSKQAISCTNCAKAKSKCVRDGRDNCDRCERLHKSCVTRQPLKRKRNAIKSSRTAQLKDLENKLEDIAQTLSAKQDYVAGDINHPLPSSQCQTQGVGPQFLEVSTSKGVLHESLAAAEAPQRDHDFQGRSDANFTILEASFQDSDILLDRYKRLMACGMPFVVISMDISASRLIESKPTLTQAICTVASFHNTDAQQLMARDLMRHISEKMLINGEMSLDILQGLLVFSTWFNPHLYKNVAHSTILQLATALIIGLRLDRPVDSCEKSMIEAASRAHGVPQPAKTMNNNERRATLGLYYLMSMIYTSFRKIDTPSWTPWLAECLAALSNAKEYESDANLVRLVQMQRIMHDAMSMKFDHAPVQFFAKSFLSDLESIPIPSSDGSIATILRLQYACTRTAIWERSFSDSNEKILQPDNLRQRLNGMWCCMEAAKAYIEVYMEMTVDDYPILPFGLFAQFAYIFVVIIRATSIEVEAWDIQSLREFIDFSNIMEEASRRYEAVNGRYIDGQVLKNDAFAKWAAKTRWARAFYDTKFGVASEDSRSRPKASLLNGQLLDGIQSQDENTLQPVQMSLETMFLEPNSHRLIDSPLPLDFDDLGSFWNDFNQTMPSA